MDAERKTNYIEDRQEMESKSENKEIMNGVDINTDKESKAEKAKRKRRSKNDQEGRTYKCDSCPRSYLSVPALTNHIKTKHRRDDPAFKRNRGRPRKNPCFNSQSEKDIIKFKAFFNDPQRQANGSYFDLYSTVTEVFEFMYDNYGGVNGKLFKKLNNITNQHNLYHVVVKNIQSTNDTDKLGQPADIAFGRYILDSYHKTNKSYFAFLVKFIILFRECMNHYRSTELSDKEFSEVKGSDIIPELCNEFITEFMETNENFDLDLNETIEIIQHFCLWLYENKYTTSRLTLLGS